MIIKTKSAAYCFIPEISVLVNAELQDEFKHLLPDKLDEQQIITILRKELSDNTIEEHIASIRNVTLNITNDCNFRCKYCIYSGNYDLVRTHQPRKMDFAIAQKTIDHLISWITNPKRKIKTSVVNIGFYGGEPLLEFPLVKRIIDYARQQMGKKRLDDKFKLTFRLNTNGFILTGDIIDFLIHENITIDVSLDGPPLEHDKFRVTRTGEKTWERIWDNLCQIKKEHPEYYANHVKYLITLHPMHDYKNIDAFFLENKDFFQLAQLSAYYVNMLLLKKEVASQWQENKLDNNSRSKLNLVNSCNRLEDKLKMKTLGYDTHFTTQCFPGEAKLFVDVDGLFHICERVKSDIPIGNVDTGFDYQTIRSVQRMWNEEIIRYRCWECPAWSFCGVCISQSNEKDGVRVECTYKDAALTMLTEFLIFKEESEKLERDQRKPPQTVRDYIRQL